MPPLTIGQIFAKYRERAGLSQAGIARLLDVKPQSIQQFEAGGIKKPKYLAEACAILNIPPEEVGLKGVYIRPQRDNMVNKEAGSGVSSVSRPRKGHSEYVDTYPSVSYIREIDARASAGGGAIVEYEVERYPWALPDDWVSTVFRSPASKLRVIAVEGDSMVSNPARPDDIHPGDYVIVNTLDTSPSPPGKFVLWDGLGLVVKRLAHIPDSEPPAVRIMSNNDAYEAYTRTLDEVHVAGRVVARFQRL